MTRVLPVALLFAIALCAGGCATRPRHYSAPDPGKLNNSTARVAKAVNDAHASAKAAKANVDQAIEKQKEISTEVKKLKDVPPILLQKIEEQDRTLGEAAVHQQDLEKHFDEADKAKADVEKDKADYFAAALKMANDAGTDSQAKADTINKQSKALWWYRLHWWGAWVALGLGVIACIFVAFLHFTGRLAAAGAVIASKVP